jgi:hypothetical protein
MLDGCGSIGAGVVTLFASGAFGWRFEAALGVVVVEERGRRVVELACLAHGLRRISRRSSHAVVGRGERRDRRNKAIPARAALALSHVASEADLEITHTPDISEFNGDLGTHPLTP